MTSHGLVPGTPQVIAATPQATDSEEREGYFAPRTRSKTANKRRNDAQQATEVAADARGRDRSSQAESKVKEDTLPARATGSSVQSATSSKSSGSTAGVADESNSPLPNGLLSPASAFPQGRGTSYWRNLSRSPSPLGLIPIHREWRDFIHKHEVPRKVLHVSIGFVTLWLYYQGAQTSQIHPVLLSGLIPVFSADVIRFQWPAFNRVYIRLLGPFMREAEAHDRFNGVISYLAGLWATMYFCHKDVAVMSVLLLSWSDTAASTIGRAYGKYTPRIRKGKSLAGSLAAFAVGVLSAVLFWGYITATTPTTLHEGYAYHGQLTLPTNIRSALGLGKAQATASGPLALMIIATISGFVASISEAIDIFGLDDNLTIPILSGLGLSAVLCAFT